MVLGLPGTICVLRAVNFVASGLLFLIVLKVF